MASRVQVLLGILAGVGTLFAECSADDETLPPELENVAGDLMEYFCGGRGDSCNPVFGASPQPPCNDEPCLCSQLCVTGAQRSCSKEHPAQVPSCASRSQKFVCEYEDAVVCSDNLGTCLYNKTGTPFCVCKPAVMTGMWTSVPGGSCTPPGLSVGLLVAVCCLSVILVVLVVIVGCCVWRHGMFCCQRERRIAAPKSDATGQQDPEVELQPSEQPVSDSLEYSYAYGHWERAPAAILPPKDEPSLDEEQPDHYYSHLKNDQKVAADEPNSEQEVGLKNGGVDGEQLANTRHDYFVLEKMPSFQDSGSEHGDTEGQQRGPPSTQRGENAPRPYVNTLPGGEPTDPTSGYEVARVQSPVPAASNQNGPGPDNRDSGYEVATAKSPGDDKRHSYFTLDQPTGNPNQPQKADSGYEEVTQGIKPQADEGDDESSAYDHLHRPGPVMPTEGEVSQL